MPDLSSPTRDRPCTPCIRQRDLNDWTAREVPKSSLLYTHTHTHTHRIFKICWQNFIFKGKNPKKQLELRKISGILPISNVRKHHEIRDSKKLSSDF